MRTIAPTLGLSIIPNHAVYKNEEAKECKTRVVVQEAAVGC